MSKNANFWRKYEILLPRKNLPIWDPNLPLRNPKSPYLALRKNHMYDTTYICAQRLYPSSSSLVVPFQVSNVGDQIFVRQILIMMFPRRFATRLLCLLHCTRNIIKLPQPSQSCTCKSAHWNKNSDWSDFFVSIRVFPSKVLGSRERFGPAVIYFFIFNSAGHEISNAHRYKISRISVSFFFSRMLFFLFLSFFLYALTSVGHQTGLGMRGQKGINGNKRSEQIRKKSSCSKMLKYQLTSVSRKNFMLRLVGHGISFITWGPGCQEIPFYIEHCKRLF